MLIKTTKAQSTIELVAGLMILIPIVLSLIDIAVFVMGVSLNDSVCRDATRAAASGPPDKIAHGQPKQRAEMVVKRSYKTEGAIRLSPDVDIRENIREPLPSEPYGGPVDGEVTVSTTVNVHPPFLVSVFCGSSGITFKSEQTFPYTWVMPSTIGDGNQKH
jgi:hypothetical protein